MKVTVYWGWTGALTVTRHSADNEPSSERTLILALPGALAVTTPFSTVATVLSLVVQRTFLLVAFSGDTVTVSVSLPPVASVKLDLSRDTPVTGILRAFTVTTQVAVLAGAATLATVIVAVPGATAVITAFSSTTATAGLSEDQRTFCMAAAGKT